MRIGRTAVLLVVAFFLGTASLARGPAGPVLAVAPFQNLSGVPLANVELGMAEMFRGILEGMGYRVVPAGALQGWAAQRGLPLRDPGVLRDAARDLGATHLIEGALEELNAVSVRISLGFLTVEGASVTARVGARLTSLADGTLLGEFSAEGRAQGRAGLSFDLTFFLSLPGDICAGGFRSSKGAYLRGEPVLFGYLDPAPPNPFYVVVEPLGGGPPSWTSPVETSSLGDPCVEWTWDQLFGPDPASPGFYRAYLYDGTPTPIATLTFEILPEPAPWAVELSVGTPEFAVTAWHEALMRALGVLAGKIDGTLRGTRARLGRRG